MNTRALTSGALLLAAWLPAQEQGDAHDALARAVMIEEQELDLPGAIAEYRRLAQDGGLPDAVRVQARLRLGLALLRAGQDAEGKTLLEALGQGEGEVAERARRALAAGAVQDEVMQRRVDAAVARLRSDREKGTAELRFLGAAAAPALAGILLAGPLDRDFLGDGLALLIELDPAVAERTLLALRERDVFVRRAAMDGLRPSGRAATDAAMLGFLQDPDEGVRAAAARTLMARFRVPGEALVAMVAGANDAVRAAAFEGAKGTAQNAERCAALRPLVEQELARSEPVPTLWPAVFSCMPTGLDALQLGLRALRHPRCQVTSVIGVPKVDASPDRLLDEVLATAEALAGFAPDGRRHQLSEIVTGLERTWELGALTGRIRLFELGFGSVDAWLRAQRPTEELTDVVLQHLGAFPLTNGHMTMALSNWNIPAERWRPFAELAEARADSAVETRNATMFALRGLHPDALAWMVRFAPTNPQAFASAIDAMSRHDELPASAREALTALLTAEVDVRGLRTAMAKHGDLQHTLRAVCAMVARHGIDEAAEWFVRACRDLKLPSVLQSLASTQQVPVRLRDETIARIVEQCAADDAVDVVVHLGTLAASENLSPPVYRVLCRVASRALATQQPSLLQSNVLQSSCGGGISTLRG